MESVGLKAAIETSSKIHKKIILTSLTKTEESFLKNDTDLEKVFRHQYVLFAAQWVNAFLLETHFYLVTVRKILLSCLEFQKLWA